MKFQADRALELKGIVFKYWSIHLPYLLRYLSKRLFYLTIQYSIVALLI
jgi:hypothetical protein